MVEPLDHDKKNVLPTSIKVYASKLKSEPLVNAPLWQCKCGETQFDPKFMEDIGKMLLATPIIEGLTEENKMKNPFSA